MAKIEIGISDINSDIEKFKKIAISIKDMINEGKCNILFGISENIRIEIDDSSLKKYPLEKKEFDKIVTRELIPILEALLDDEKDDFINMQIRRFKETVSMSNQKEDKLSKYETELNLKVKFIEDMFIDDKIKNRYIIKMTTKHSKISRIGWEINKKLFELNENKSIDPVYATLEIKTIRNIESDNPITKLFPFIQQENNINQVLIDLDEGDIDFLIKTFSDIKMKLNRIEQD